MTNKIELHPSDQRTVRASVSFPTKIHKSIQRLAKEKKVSAAWIVREAVERYVNDHEQ